MQAVDGGDQLELVDNESYPSQNNISILSKS